jgi:hypothetical protein
VKPLYVILLVAVIVSLAFWAGRCSAPEPTPVVYPDEPLPVLPDTVHIHHHHYHEVAMPEDVAALALWQERYDSLLAAHQGNADSMARWLATPWNEAHTWRAEQPAVDFLAAGTLRLHVEPLIKDVQPQMVMDTLKLPKPQVRIEKQKVVDYGWLAGAFGAGAAVVAIIVAVVNK